MIDKEKIINIKKGEVVKKWEIWKKIWKIKKKERKMGNKER
jgi:3-deoxy-D-manno-octulosonic acid (KDO) 8-phosphate synthase